MSFKIEDLQDESRFRLIKSLYYDEIVEFVFENIQKRNFLSIFYFFINTLFLVLIVSFSISGFRNDLFIFKHYAVSLILGMIAGTIVVIPIHEILHGIAYKIAGAPRVDFGADLKQGIFYVAANNYVINRKQFTFVAMTPFIFINTISLIFINLFTPYFFIGILFFLFFHNIMCIGDFAMLSYFRENNDKELYTYDNHKEKKSYIYQKL